MKLTGYLLAAIFAIGAIGCSQEEGPAPENEEESKRQMEENMQKMTGGLPQTPGEGQAQPEGGTTP